MLNTTTYTVRDLVEFKKAGTLEISPNFQRNPVWRKNAKSYLIDTIMRGYPMPPLLFRESESKDNIIKTIREVVDGQQRIRTVLSFIDSSFLDDYKESEEFTVSRIHNKEIAGKKFNELSDKNKSKILNYKFLVNTLPSETSDKEILEIFSRINSTGIKLNSQELRNAAYQGEFKTVVFGIATSQYNNWIEWGVFSKNDIARMGDSELISEFAEFILMNKIKGKEQKSLNKLYENKDDVFEEKNIVSKKIEDTLEIIERAYGPNLKESFFRTKGFFFILFVFVYKVKKQNELNISMLRKFLSKVDKKVKNDELESIFESRRNTTLGAREKAISYLIKNLKNE